MNSFPRRTRYDAVIVGSGHNGLVAAAYLGRAGRSVLVLERNPEPGGASVSQRVFPEYDAWLSRYAYLISLFPQRIIDDLSLTFATRRRATASFTPWIDAAGQHRGLLVSNEDPQRTRDSLKELTGSDSEWQSWQQFAVLQQAIARLAWPSLLEPLRSREDFRKSLAGADQIKAWEAFVERPLGEIVERMIHSDLLRGLLMTDGKIGVLTQPHDESLLQNRCFLYHVIGNETGEWRVPVGGMKSLINSLLDVCRRAGVELLTSAAATAVHPGETSQSVEFETADGTRTVEATDVLMNAGPATQARLLGTPWSPDSADEGSVVKMNLLLTRLPKLKAAGVSSAEAFAGSFHLNEGYQQMIESFYSASAGQVPNPAPFEMYCHTLTDDSILSPDLRQRGFHTLTVFGLDVPWRVFATEHDARRNQIRDAYLAALDAVCDNPVSDCIARNRDGSLCLEIRTPQDLQRELDLDQGNIFHNAPSWFFTDDASQEGRWGVESRHPHILRAGSSAHRGGAVSGIPGHNAAMCILQRR